MIDIKKQEPAMYNLPDGVIDWVEISGFIVDMLKSDVHRKNGWRIIDDFSMTESLKKNSLVVLHILYEDLYGYFYIQHGERFEIWHRMEKFIRTKYNALSEQALSNIIARYKIDDR